MNKFQFKIFIQICISSTKGENLVISPLSIYHILSLTTNGAVGNTKKEMLTALENDSQEEINQNNKIIKSIINNFKTVEFANSIFSRFIPLSTFIEKAKDYKIKIDKLIDENQINNWCCEHTHGLIKKILEKIYPEDIIVLINAIYFKGLWEIEFNKRFTEEREFLNYQKEKKLIRFMHSNDFYRYFEKNDIQAISLNYQKDNIEALIILPKNEYDINNYIEIFDQKEYSNIIKGLNIQKVELYLPKFEIKFNTELKNIFQELGIKLAFKSDANFSSMTKSQAIYISRIIHSSYIKVDEKGTEASAVTAVVGTRGGRPHQCLERSIIMDINHPFLFIIRNKDLPPGHDILFISKVENLDRDEAGKESKKSQNINTKEKERKKIDFSKLEYVNISFKKPVKWYMYIIKLVLQNRESVDIKARPLGASQAIRVVEALKRLGYISYVKYCTSTVVNDGKLERYIIINVKKTKDFQKLFDEREAERKRILESQKKLF